MKKIKFDKKFQKSLLSLEKSVQFRILEKIESLGNEDENLDVKKMQPKYLGYYRLRVGRYRIIFELENGDTIILLKVDNRDSIYSNF